MMPYLLNIINPDTVEERHYFLEILKTPEILWGIRTACILAALAVFIIYLICRKKAAAQNNSPKKKPEAEAAKELKPAKTVPAAQKPEPEPIPAQTVPTVHEPEPEPIPAQTVPTVHEPEPAEKTEKPAEKSKQSSRTKENLLLLAAYAGFAVIYMGTTIIRNKKKRKHKKKK